MGHPVGDAIIDVCRIQDHAAPLLALLLKETQQLQSAKHIHVHCHLHIEMISFKGSSSAAFSSGTMLAVIHVVCSHARNQVCWNLEDSTPVVKTKKHQALAHTLPPYAGTCHEPALQGGGKCKTSARCSVIDQPATDENGYAIHPSTCGVIGSQTPAKTTGLELHMARSLTALRRSAVPAAHRPTLDSWGAKCGILGVLPQASRHAGAANEHTCVMRGGHIQTADGSADTLKWQLIVMCM